MDDPKDVTILLKWCGKEFAIVDLNELDTVAMLRHEICKHTQVKPERQKLLNLKYKGANAPDDVRLGLLQLKANYKLMMVGSLEADIEGVSRRPTDLEEVVDDFDEEEARVQMQKYQIWKVYNAKVKKRVRDYPVHLRYPLRRGKRLLVLDIDYTLFDHRTEAESGAELMRPYLHEFLTAAYEHYDIVIWSATGMRWIDEKMRMLGVATNPHYRIAFYMDWGAMITVFTKERGVSECKPLGVIWGKYPNWSAKNTIMFDDIRRNFLMNPQSGLRIRPYRRAHTARASDQELLRLKKYLRDIALHCDDFTVLNHNEWESYQPPATPPRAVEMPSSGDEDEAPASGPSSEGLQAAGAATAAGTAQAMNVGGEGAATTTTTTTTTTTAVMAAAAAEDENPVGDDQAEKTPGTGASETEVTGADGGGEV